MPYSRNITVYLPDSMVGKGAYKKTYQTALRESLPGRCYYYLLNRKGANDYGKQRLI